MKVTHKKVVQIDYILKNEKGEVLDSTQGGEPLHYIHGIGQIVVGLEDELEGRQQGDSFKVEVPPEKGYGPRDEKLVQEFPKEVFKDLKDLKEGILVEADTEDGITMFHIQKVTDTKVTVDQNDPLAGKTLFFEGTILHVRDASPEEMDHGHVHGPGGHQH